MPDCTLCGQRAPDPPVTRPDTPGQFCCNGCLQVFETLRGAEGINVDDVRERISNGTDEHQTTEASAEPQNTFLSVDGMHCSTCEAFLETVARRQNSVHDASASYSSGLLRISHDPDALDARHLAKVISGLGYHARPVGNDPHAEDDSKTIGRLLVGGLFGMMTMLWYVLFLYPSYYGATTVIDIEGMTGSYLLYNVWVMASLVLGYTGFPILRGALVSLRVGKPNMDLLITLAAGSAYLYSAVAVLAGHTEVYFDVSVVVIMAVSLGNYYEKRLRRRAGNLLSDLTARQADHARVRANGTTQNVPVGDLSPADHVVVRQGERVPVDGTIVDGQAAVDESLVTGESIPRTKTAGDTVIGGSTVVENAITIEVGDEVTSTVDRLVNLIWNIQSSTPGVQQIADRLAAVFVPAVLVLGGGATLLQLYLGQPVVTAFLTGLTVLIVSCPCALGLATPLAVASGVRNALKRGIVISSGSVFEAAPEVEIIAFDKTGTLTTGDLVVMNSEKVDDTALVRAAAVEALSGHPVARAVTRAISSNRSLPAATDFRSYPQGAEAKVDGRQVIVGRPDLFREKRWKVRDHLLRMCEEITGRSQVPVLVGWDGAAQDVIEVGAEPREEWTQILQELRHEERRLVLITGDTEASTRAFSTTAYFDEVYADVRPEGKVQIIRMLRNQGHTAMIGDGVNDAPSLAEADLGIAMGTAALTADAADVVITDNRLETLPDVFALTGGSRTRIRQNLGWAFLYNIVAIPLAVVGAINPLLAAAAMAGSSLLVVANSARSIS